MHSATRYYQYFIMLWLCLFFSTEAVKAQQPDTTMPKLAPAQPYKFAIMARMGEVVEGLTIKNFALRDGFYVVLNNKGQAAFMGETDKGIAIFRYTPSIGQAPDKLEVIARVGEVQDKRQIVRLEAPSIDATGHVSYIVDFRNDGQVEADPSTDHLAETIVAKLKAKAGGREPANEEQYDKLIQTIRQMAAQIQAKRKITVYVAVDHHAIYSFASKLKNGEVPYPPYYDSQSHLILPIAPASALVDGKRDAPYASRIHKLLPNAYNDKGQVFTDVIGLPTGQRLVDSFPLYAMNQNGKLLVDASSFHILDYTALAKLPPGGVYIGKVSGSYPVFFGDAISHANFLSLIKLLGAEGENSVEPGELGNGAIINDTHLARYNRGQGGAINESLQIAFPVRYLPLNTPHAPDGNQPHSQAIVLGTPGVIPMNVFIRADANRDGQITFDDTDNTMDDKPYTFWLNDNSDVLANGEWEDQDPATAKQVDNSLSTIPNPRDFEDFERLQIKLPLGFDAASGSWKITLQFTAASDDPEINVVPAPDTSISYLTTAVNVGAFGKKIGPIANEEVALPLSDLHIQDGIVPLLFEGVGKGKGALKVYVYKSGVDVATDQVYLDLKPITDMYDHYTADPLETGNLQSDSGDSNGVKREQILNSPRLVNQDVTKHETNDYILFVHGWRMQRWERIAFGQTAFKRLWHLGYKGHFGLFSWPTEYTEANPISMASDPSNYDDSEQKAFISAQTLHSLLVSLNNTNKGHVYVFAHSMGNIVTSEALRLEATSGTPKHLVEAYVASQAAVPAQSYDASRPSIRTPNTPNIYAFYPTGSPSTGFPYFGKLRQAAGKLVNFYNPIDYALTGGDAKIKIIHGWGTDQYFKPDVGYGYDEKTGFYQKEELLPLDTPEDTLTPLNILTDQRYEIFAKAASAYSNALGAQGDVGIPFAKDEQVNLHDSFGFSGKDTDHSAQFEEDFSKRYEYWERLITTFGLPKPIPN